METFLVEDLSSFRGYIGHLQSMRDFSSTFYPITPPVASIEVDFFKIQRAQWGTIEDWTGMIEMAYELGGGVFLVQSAWLSNDNLTMSIIEVAVRCQQRYSTQRHTLREISLAGKCQNKAKMAQLLELEAFSSEWITKLDLSQNRLRDADLALVLVQISMASNLETLVLDGNVLGKESVEVLCPWLREPSCPLRCLSIRDCGLGIKGVFEQLLQCLGSAPFSKISTLHVSRLPLGAGVGEVLTQALLNSDRPAFLRTLSIDESRFSDDDNDMIVLAKLLRSTKLETLSLGECTLRDNHLSRFLDEFELGEQEDEEEGKKYGLNVDGLVLNNNDELLMGRFVAFSRSRLRELDVSHCVLGNPKEQRLANLDRLFEAVGQSVTIETFKATAINSGSGAHLETLMKAALGPQNVVSKLSRIIMDHIPIGNKSMKIAAAYIARKPNHPFRHLSFCSCMGGDGYDMLFKILKKEAKVETLTISRGDAWEVASRGGESLPPPIVLSNRYEPPDVKTRYSVILALSTRDADGQVHLSFPKEIYLSIFDFSLRPLKRRVLVK